jgi:urease accessory protein UreE
MVGPSVSPEAVSIIRCGNALMLTRGAYHLVSRHVPMQIGDDSLRYQRDYVLDDMIRQLGFDIVPEMAPFEPEAGAYGALADVAAGGQAAIVRCEGNVCTVEGSHMNV